MNLQISRRTELKEILPSSTSLIQKKYELKQNSDSYFISNTQYVYCIQLKVGGEENLPRTYPILSRVSTKNKIENRFKYGNYHRVALFEYNDLIQYFCPVETLRL